MIANPAGFELLERDVRNVCTWFERRGVPNDADALFSGVCADALG